MNKEEVIKELKNILKKLNKSPGRREISFRLYYHCIKNFGSFNKAKLSAGLSIVKRKCDPLLKKAYKLDKELASVVSYLTFDGHLYKDLKGIIFMSNELKTLKYFERLIKNKFGLIGSYRFDMGQYGKNCKNYRVFNSNLCKFLHSIGTPKGDKMITSFDIPNWIKKDKNLAKEYLKIAFLCEGSKYKVSNKNKERIQINLNKTEDLLEDGLTFMSSLKDLLNLFDIETTKTYICKGNLRKKDGKTTKLMKFNIKPNSINKFINQIGWYK